MNTQRKMTRRQRRKVRPVLNIGDTGIEGTVVKRPKGKSWGFIQPVDGAANIFFDIRKVPHHRQKCVGLNRKVFFEVVKGNKGRHGHRRLAAIVL